MDIKKFKFKIDFKNPVTIGVIAAAGLLVVIIGVYYYFMYSGLKAKLTQKKAALQAVEAKYNADLMLVRSYPVLVKQQKKLDKEFASLIMELPPKKNIPDLLMKISNDEKMLGLSLKMFKPGKVVPRGFYESVPFSMNISGPFFNTYKFFYKLAKMKRIVDVHDVSISNGKGNTVSVNFNGTTYSFTGMPQKTAVKKNVAVIKK